MGHHFILYYKTGDYKCLLQYQDVPHSKSNILARIYVFPYSQYNYTCVITYCIPNAPIYCSTLTSVSIPV